MSDNGLSGVSGSSTFGTLTDQHGNVLISSSTDGDGSAGLGPTVRRMLTAGIANGDFVATPLADSAITSHNVLPVWTWTVVSGTAVEMTSIIDTASASGRILRLAMATGAANDEAYVEQIAPVNGSRGQNFAYAVKCYFLAATSATANVSVRVTGQFLKSDGTTTTGAAVTVDSAFSTLGAAGDIVVRMPASYSPLPSDAYLLRIRIGLVRTGGTTDTGSIDLTEVRVITGTDEYLIVDSTTPANVTGILTKAGGTLTLAGQAPGTAGAKLTLAGVIATLNSPSGVSPASLAVEAARGVTVTLTSTGGLFTVTGGSMVIIPGAQTVSAATDTLASLLGSYLDITVSGGPFTMTSAPTIANGVDGQELTLVNVSGNAITISDQGTLANSNLRLSTATYVISTRDSIKLRYSSTISDWFEVARTNVI